MSQQHSQQHILQVSELTKKVRFILESELSRVWLCGEISNFVAASSGHWYLSLKDSKSQVRCAMFKGNNQRVRLNNNALARALPENGQQVLVRAKVSLYEPRGDFQLIIEQMEDAGEGLLRQQYEQLKQKLNAEGLFAQACKKIIPTDIQSVGIITSPTGAAVKDILTVLKRRNPNLKAIIYPALVQGQQAAQDISTAIKIANARQECDVLIVGRGGGSLEDLWSFNEEMVVRAIYLSQLPIISAVGHEIDTTLADYVADLRAATPSAAAELVSQDASKLAEKMTELNQRMVNAGKRRVIEQQKSLSHLQHRLSQVHPAQQLQNQQQKADELTLRLQQAIQRQMQYFNQLPQQLNQRLLQVSPQNNIHQNAQRIHQLQQRLTSKVQGILQQKSVSFANTIEQLQLVSPLATIARGYSVARNKKAQVIRRTNQVTIGEKIDLQVSDGEITMQVIDK